MNMALYVCFFIILVVQHFAASHNERDGIDEQYPQRPDGGDPGQDVPAH
jgi:hypothetical protein